MTVNSAHTQTLADLRERLAEAEQRAREFRRAIAFIEHELLGTDGASPARRSPSREADKGQGYWIALAQEMQEATMVKAVELVLRHEEKQLHIKDIFHNARELGYRYDGTFKRFRASVTPQIHKMVELGDTFTKPAPATYGLLEGEAL